MEGQISDLYRLGVAHNVFPIVLPDGSYYPDHLEMKDRRPLEFLTHFNRVRDKNWSDCTFLDLGCSEGSTTFGISQMGSSACGVEGRADGVERAQALAKILGFTNTTFAVGNVVDPAAFRQVDGIFAAGILYHLEDPIGFLESCARNSRSFVYIDTGHMPRSPEEQTKSKFVRQFGAPRALSYKGLTINAINFAEPGDLSEKQGTRRRHPRSGIGNTNSVWLLHSDMIELMKELGFPFHETVSDSPNIPRLRTCFFRTEPRPKAKLGQLAKPLPQGLPSERAVAVSRERDLEHLRRTKAHVTVVGWQPLVNRVAEYLKQQDIAVDLAPLPGEASGTAPLPALRETLKGKRGFVALAVQQPHKSYDNLMLLDQFDYVFTSFALALK